MPDTLVPIAVGLQLILSLTVLWTTLCALNEMNRKTPFFRRVAFVLLGTGAFASLLTQLFPQRQPTATELLLFTAIAVLRITDIVKTRQADRLVRVHAAQQKNQ
jgi:hypothetical protein